MASGEMTAAEFGEFLAAGFQQMSAHAQDGALAYICMDWRHLDAVQASARGVFSELRNLCVWAKTNAGMGALCRSQHELVWVYKIGTAPHVNKVELGKHGRYRTNVWRCAGGNTFRNRREDELAMHPTAKPVALVADVLLDASRRRSAMPSKYPVGYGRLPVHSRFRKGHSGNPRGRPKGTRNLATDLAEELGESIHIRENERPIRASKQRALIKALTAKTIKGATRAAALLVNLLWRVLEREGPPTVDQPLSQDDAAVLAAFLAHHRASRTDPKSPHEPA